MVQSKIPDLKCNIEKVSQNIVLRAAGACSKIRTEILMILYFAFYGCNIFLPVQFNNWLVSNISKGASKLKGEEI
jgi:hypothetical protein